MTLDALSIASPPQLKGGINSHPLIINSLKTKSSRGWTRTSDKVVNSHPLYQLSYAGVQSISFPQQYTENQTLVKNFELVFSIGKRVSFLFPCTDKSRINKECFKLSFLERFIINRDSNRSVKLQVYGNQAHMCKIFCVTKSAISNKSGLICRISLEDFC